MLIAGFTIDANTGDHMFLYSPDGPWPPDSVPTGPGKKLFALQPQDKDGRFTGCNGDTFTYELYSLRAPLNVSIRKIEDVQRRLA